MSKRQPNRQKPIRVIGQATTARSLRRNLWHAAGVVIGLVAGALIVWMIRPSPLLNGAPRASDAMLDFGNLLGLSADGATKIDVALMNLLCAKGLPGSETLDISAALATLDQWTARVKSETNRYLDRVLDSRYADHYQRSEARYRAEMLVQVLQEDLGVHYSAERIETIDFKNSKDLFIHGMLNDRNGGTCVSMPVLYTAISRRLGYPVKLVEAKSHLFCRWDGTGPGGQAEHFNFEGTGDGFSIFDDKHYQSWPKSISEGEIARGEYLQSLTAAQELAVFFAIRGHCLLDNGQVREAQVMYAHAHRLHPVSRDFFEFLADSIQRELPSPSFSPPSSMFGDRPVPRHLNTDVDQMNEMNRARQLSRRSAAP